MRLAGIFFTVLLFLVCTAVWFAFDPEIRAAFTISERVTAVAMGLGIIAIVYALGRSRLTVAGERVTVVNGYRRRQYERNEVVNLSMRRGEPWARLDLSDGSSVPVMGIQSADGPRSEVALQAARDALEAGRPTD